LLLTAKTISATDAWRIGFVHGLVPHEDLERVSRECALGKRTIESCPARTAELAAIERFFASHRADELHSGAAETGGDPVLVRAMRLVAGKAPIALRLAEWMIEEGMQRTLREGLQMEKDHVLEIFRTQDAYLGLSFRARRQVGQPPFAGR
jgi:enoyl-CoA hydratase/carnithine racemase